MRIVGNVWHVWFGIFTPSDELLKDQVDDLDSVQCIKLLEKVSAESYIRTDIENQRRVGFIAQNVDSSLGGQLINTIIVGEATYNFGNRDDCFLKSYGRMSVVLWQCCRNLLDKVEKLEPKLSSQYIYNSL